MTVVIFGGAGFVGLNIANALGDRGRAVVLADLSPPPADAMARMSDGVTFSEVDVTRPDEMFAVDRFHPSGSGYRRTAKALLPSVLVALGIERELPFGHYGPSTDPPADDPEVQQPAVLRIPGGHAG